MRKRTTLGRRRKRTKTTTSVFPTNCSSGGRVPSWGPAAPGQPRERNPIPNSFRIHSFIHSFNYSSIHSFIHRFFFPCLHSFIHAFIHPSIPKKNKNKNVWNKIVFGSDVLFAMTSFSGTFSRRPTCSGQCVRRKVSVRPAPLSLPPSDPASSASPLPAELRRKVSGCCCCCYCCRLRRRLASAYSAGFFGVVRRQCRSALASSGVVVCHEPR